MRSGRPGFPATPMQWLAGIAAFGVEIALAVTAAAAGYRLVGGLAGWLAGGAALTGLIAIWATWMSPRAGNRLPLGGRLLVGGGLVVMVAGVTYAGGAHTWGLIFGIAGLVTVLVSQAALDH